ncbi:MAG: imelysin [Arcobacter sp.]|nr:MAG: imelysin [Arcobacter sp.]
MKFSKSILSSMSLVAVMALSGCGGGGGGGDETPPATVTPTTGITAAQSTAVLTTYADIALASYTDSITAANTLKTAIDTFVDAGAGATQGQMDAAKQAWIDSREPYLETEIFRLSGGPIDGDGSAQWVKDAYGELEGQLNAWPLDEAMIDTIIATGNANTGGGIVARTTGTADGAEGGSTDVDMETFDAQDGTVANLGAVFDTTTITTGLITSLNEAGGDANVASGYHAVEFLLWGQDQDYNKAGDPSVDLVTPGATVAGQRPLTDYTNGSGEATRRGAYLKAAANKIIADLTMVRSAWLTTTSGDCDSANVDGCYRAALLGELTGSDTSKNIDATTALKDIMTGMGVFVSSELSAERISASVDTASEEDEHSCFSDNTHRDIAQDIKGFVNTLKGQYTALNPADNIDAATTTSFYDLVSDATKANIDAALTSIDTKVSTIDNLAKTTKHFDYQIIPGADADRIKALATELVTMGNMMVNVGTDIGISIN